MKKIYLLLIILVVGIRLAHAQDTTSLAGKLQFIFAQLNRSDISTGFLEERGFPLVSLTPFNPNWFKCSLFSGHLNPK